MTNSKPRVLATRHFPSAVEARLMASFDAVLEPRGPALRRPRLAKATEGCEGIMVRRGRSDERRHFASLPASVKIVSTFSVGYEHIDVAAAAKRKIAVTIHPRRADRRHRRHKRSSACWAPPAGRTEGTTMLRTTTGWAGSRPSSWARM